MRLSQSKHYPATYKKIEADRMVSLYCQYVGRLISRVLSKVVANSSIIQWNRIEILSWNETSLRYVLSVVVRIVLN